MNHAPAKTTIGDQEFKTRSVGVVRIKARGMQECSARVAFARLDPERETHGVVSRESEISRLTALQQETAAALADANARLKSITPADPATTEKLRADLTARNEAIATQNDALKKLTAERDNLVRQLNDRTREWNELVRKSSRRPSD